MKNIVVIRRFDLYKYNAKRHSNLNPMKMAKCIIELERIKGVNKHGGDRKSNQDNLDLISQKDLVNKIGVIQRAKSELFEFGKTKRVSLKIYFDERLITFLEC